MHILYLDNFRGFQNTLIDISDVNFLVGENSTGKSSILQLIHAISKPSFTYNLGFNTDEYQFGGFLDIFSKEPSDNNYIRVGYIKYENTSEIAEMTEENEKENDEQLSCILLELKNINNNPSIYGFNYVVENLCVRLKISKNYFRYKYTKIDYSDNKFEDLKNILNSWIKLPIQEDKNFSQIKFRGHPSEIPRNLFIRAFAEHLIKLELEEENKQTKEKKQEIEIPFVKWFMQGDFISPNYWFAPVRSKPLRTYDSLELQFSPEGNHIPMLIRKILMSNRKDEFLKFIQEFGDKSGLLENINIHKFSSSGMSPFELNIVFNRSNIRISDVGYGISQLLPIIVEIFWQPNGSWFSIQQPEIHLHPKAQAAVGDLLYKFAKEDRKKFLIETHSDFLIDRFRMAMRDDNNANKPQSKVLFFERERLRNLITSIKINDNGSYSEEQPESFRDFFINEELNNLGF